MMHVVYGVVCAKVYVLGKKQVITNDTNDLTYHNPSCQNAAMNWGSLPATAQPSQELQVKFYHLKRKRIKYIS